MACKLNDFLHENLYYFRFFFPGFSSSCFLYFKINLYLIADT